MSLNVGKRRSAVVVACVLSLLACMRAARGAETIKVQNVSKSYDLEVSVAACGGEGQDGDANRCSGPATVRVFRKGSKTPFQTLRMPNVELYKDTAAFSPETSEKPRGLYAEEYSFVFDDFNFDGREDLAVCNGRNGGYAGPSYTVFLFDKRAGRFVENRRLSRLAEGPYLGLFFPDAKAKTLAAFSKDGCCYHETEVYKVVGDRPVLVEKVIEDATSRGGAPEGYVLVTTRKRVGARWVVTKKRQKLEPDTPDRQN
jgi:hypothetical protein